MKVGRYDYEGQIDDWPTLLAAIERVLRGGDYVLGEDVASFERELAQFLEVPHTLGTNSGTDALILAHRTAGLGKGARVVTQANTFHATAAAIHLVGAELVLVDADPHSFTMDVEALQALDGNKLDAIVPVHLYGRPCDMDAITAFAESHSLCVIEDAAQAIGARYRGRRAGSLGDFGCISFHPSKNLAAAGDGGAISFRNGTKVAHANALRSLGQVAQNDHQFVGYNSKLDTIQALVLRVKLKQLDSWNADRRRIASAYTERLAGLPMRFQSAPEHIEHVYHLFQIRVERRDELHRTLQAAGIDAVVRYPVPIHLQPAFADCNFRPGQFPVSEALSRELLALPIRPGMPDDEIDFVADQCRTFFGTTAD